MRQFAIVTLALFAGCMAPVDTSRWRSEVAFAGDVKLGGCCVANLDPARPGNEIAVVGADGSVTLIARNGDRWESERIAQLPGEMVPVSYTHLTLPTR